MPADTEVISEFQKIADTMHAAVKSETKTREEKEAAIQKSVTDVAALVEKLPATIETVKIELKAEIDKAHEGIRLVKEKSARPPAGFGGAPDGDMRSLGTRFAEMEQYKAWAANDHRTKAPLQLGLKGRIRQPLEVKAGNTIVETGLPMLPTRVGYFAPPTLPLAMRDLLTVVQLTSGNSIEYVLETWNYAADYQVLEGDKKAQGDVTYLEKTANVRTIAWFVKVSRQMMADAPYFASTIDNQLLYGVAKKEDHEILFGDNSAGHLHGIMPQATALPADVLTDIANAPDQILSAIAYLSSLGYTPTAIVLNPIDWASMQIAKTAQGVYLLGGPPAAFASSTLWGLPVVTSSEMTAGQFLVGAFPPNATLFDRESASVDVAYENEDDFVRNLVTLRCEERIALAVYRPQAFVTGAVIPTVLPLGTSRSSGGIAPPKDIKK
jgi:HK97 family phage major capsid protein